MNLRHTLTAAAAVLLAATAQAHDCSGGTDGGMDATGNQCNEPASFVAAAPASADDKSGAPTVLPPTVTVRPARIIAARMPDGSERLARATTAQGR